MPISVFKTGTHNPCVPFPSLNRPARSYRISQTPNQNEQTMRFLHASDIHLGKTYRTSDGEAGRYSDFFNCLAGIVADAIATRVDCVLIDGDLFHVGQILPKTFARTIETLQPLKDAGIPCTAIERNA